MAYQQDPWRQPAQPLNAGRVALGAVGLFVAGALLGTGVGWVSADQKDDTLPSSPFPSATRSEPTLWPSDPADPSDPSSSETESSEPPSDPPTSSEPSEEEPSEEEPSEEDLEREALSALKRQADDDRDALTISGQWVAQVASKSVGIYDPQQETASGSHTFYAVDIWAEHQQLRETFGQSYEVRLVRGQDFKRKTSSDDTFWFTFVLDDFDSEDDANAWCRSEFSGLDEDELANRCFGRRLDPN